MDDLFKREIAISLPSMGEDEWQALREPIMSGCGLRKAPRWQSLNGCLPKRHRVKHALA